jgi:hypothetical protein
MTVKIETAFQLTEHLKALYNAAIHPDGSTNVVPIDRATATRLAQPPDGIEKSMWLYELCRFLVQKVNSILVALFNDDPPCSMQTCSEMRASEWQYLCAVHDPPKPCCAIDYCCHTLDWACDTLTSTKNFPSRMSLGMENGSNTQQMRQLTNIFRRVYRIFAHAWFQHRAVFWDVESKGGLYVFFKTVCDVYNLIPVENYTVPPEAEGIESPPPPQRQSHPTILKKNVGDQEASSVGPEEEHHAPPAAHPTQRHRQSASVDGGSISTVVEEPEEDAEKSPKKEEESEEQQAKIEDFPEAETEVEPEVVAKDEAEEGPEVAAKAIDEPLAEEPKEEPPVVAKDPVEKASAVTTPSPEQDAAPAVEQEDEEAKPDETIKLEPEPEKEKKVATEPKEEPVADEPEETPVAEALEHGEENIDPAVGEKEDATAVEPKDPIHTTPDTYAPTPLVLTEPKTTSSSSTHEAEHQPEAETEETPAHFDPPTVKSQTDHLVPSKATESTDPSDPKADAKDEGEATKTVGD